MNDPVNHPKHYNIGGLETIDIIESRLTREEFVGYLKGSKMKYDLRKMAESDTSIQKRISDKFTPEFYDWFIERKAIEEAKYARDTYAQRLQAIEEFIVSKRRMRT